MVKELFFFLCIVHVLCDFYFQSQIMADKKRKNMFWLMIHILVYAICALIIFKIVLTGLSWSYCVLFVIAHAIIDCLKYIISNSKFAKMKNIEFDDTVIFFVDQVLHILIIGWIVYALKNLMLMDLYNREIMKFFNEIHVQETQLISWVLKIILVCKPANVFITNILKKYRPKEEVTNTDRNTGRFIGVLERIIITILITINQYSAVGLVLTAKSIARYDKISKNQEFAEYYLLGTLLSTICSVVIAIII